MLLKRVADGQKLTDLRILPYSKATKRKSLNIGLRKESYVKWQKVPSRRPRPMMIMIAIRFPHLFNFLSNFLSVFRIHKVDGEDISAFSMAVFHFIIWTVFNENCLH